MEDALLVITAGAALAEKFASLGKPIEQTVPRLELSLEDILVREDVPGSQPIRVLYLGFLLTRKGVEYLLRALPILRQRGVRLVLTVAGDGEQRGELHHLAEELELGDTVRFVGHVPHGPAVLNLYREHDIYILPTLAEGFPRTLYEAMSQSIPIITTPVGGIPGLMKHEQNALLVPTRSPEAIAEAVQRLAGEPALRRRLIANGLRTVRGILGRDAGEQVDTLLREHFPPYRMWAEARTVSSDNEKRSTA